MQDHRVRCVEATRGSNGARVRLHSPGVSVLSPCSCYGWQFLSHPPSRPLCLLTLAFTPSPSPSRRRFSLLFKVLVAVLCRCACCDCLIALGLWRTTGIKRRAAGTSVRNGLTGQLRCIFKYYYACLSGPATGGSLGQRTGTSGHDFGDLKNTWGGKLLRGVASTCATSDLRVGVFFWFIESVVEVWLNVNRIAWAGAWSSVNKGVSRIWRNSLYI